MPRRKTAVKNKSIGAIDIHFHGAFGIDLMTARASELDDLAVRMGRAGIAAFCATTLSVPFPMLRDSVQRLGQWILSERKPGGAIPLGIHLEGPYIHPGACGAHPAKAIRAFDFAELELLWEDSHHQLKILTIAPERLTRPQLKRLAGWASKRGVTLSLGHSKATEEQATRAFDAGFSGITHGWNALPFHHRHPGPMGAALGRPGIGIELILDQVHVSPTLLRWTRALHPEGPLCYVSDCVPATNTAPGSWHKFGNLKIRFQDGACRLKKGELAGGGLLLPEAFARWVEREADRLNQPVFRVLQAHLPHVTSEPLRYLGLKKLAPWLLKNRPVEWAQNAAGNLKIRSAF